MIYVDWTTVRKLEKNWKKIYQKELILNKENHDDKEASFLDLLIKAEQDICDLPAEKVPIDQQVLDFLKVDNIIKKSPKSL